MTPEERETLATQRKKTGLKVMMYNRFLLIRYVCALLFFINLYACLLYYVSHSNLIILPVILILAQLPAIWEQIKLYSTPMNIVNFTQGYFILQTAALIGILIACTTPLFSYIFPFLTVSFTVRLTIAIGALCLTGICLAMLIKISKISVSRDKQYQRIQQYKQTL